MCGFVGIANFEKNKAVSMNTLKLMNDSINHRGPDDEGYIIMNSIGLGFKRLSIIDLKLGRQPMPDTSKSIWIVFNGEIYNYKEIKFRLEHRGYSFYTNSDTEVIINAYKEYGKDCLDLFRGMFSFVIYDKNNNTIFLARDRFGIKPMYYLKNNHTLVFASELKAILKAKISKKIIDSRALDSFFTYGYIQSPLSIYTDIKKLPSSHYLIIDLNSDNLDIEPIKYWQPTFNINSKIGFEEYEKLIIEKLRETVQTHLVSDVPVGAFLSGGIDSNSVVSLMTQLYEGKIKTFTIGFNEKKYNESPLARLASEKYGTEHHEIIIEKKSVSSLEEIIGLYDEPFGDSSSIPTFFVSKLASQYVKVVLSGDGGDEFFGGYNSYQRLQKMRKYNLPFPLNYLVFRPISKILSEKFPGKRFSYILSQNPRYYYAYFNQVWYDEQAKLFTPEVLANIRMDPIQNSKIEIIKNSRSNDYPSRMMELDILTYLTDDILTKVDRASMANSLEVRVPIIDHEFFSLASSIPTAMKLKGKKGKYIFREAMRNYLPQEIYSLNKQGFTIPINDWFKDDLIDFVQDTINSGNIMEEFINPDYIRKLKNTKNLGSLVTRLYPLLVFNFWLNKYHSK